MEITSTQYNQHNMLTTPENISGVDTVMDTIEAISNQEYHAPAPKLKNLTTIEQAYADWLRDKTPANMSNVIEALAPTINSEITHYAGPKSLLRSKAKVLAIQAVKNFDPMSGAKLNSWVVTNLQPLARYSVKQRDIHISEGAARTAAKINAESIKLRDELGRDPTDEELADELGISASKIQSIRSKAVATVNSSIYDEVEDSDDASSTPGVTHTDPTIFAQEAVYRDLSPEDKYIFDAATGSHGVPQAKAIEVATKLGITPAAVSQKAKAISSQIAYIANTW